VTPPAAVTAPPAAARLREDLIHPDPLLDCLVEVCRLHGVGASRASLSAGLPLVAGRLTLELAERAAARVGMSARLQRLPLAELDASALPAVLILNGNKACVLQGFGNEGARVLLPETGQGSITLPLDELAKRYSGVVLFVRPHFRFDQRTPVQRGTRRGHWFWTAVLAQRFVYRDVMLAALLVNLFALAFPLFSMNVYDRVVPNNAVETLGLASA
jgi:ATP-binding cassette subfamily C protein LapB